VVAHEKFKFLQITAISLKNYSRYLNWCKDVCTYILLEKDSSKKTTPTERQPTHGFHDIVALK
jgi:hypothetical protein